MKKIIVTMMLFSFVIISCKKEENRIQEPMKNTPVESMSESPETVGENYSENAIPTFTDAEADKFAREYQTFVRDYQIAKSNNDTEALKVLGPKHNDFHDRYVELAKRVPQEESVAFTDFFNSLEQTIK